jgi:two-component system invasion response regulator UvrY
MTTGLPLRVLLVDDDERVRRGIARVLAIDVPGVHIGEAPDAETALEMVPAGAWDVLLLDISMPGMTGLEALKDLRARDIALPVIIVSGLPPEMYRPAAMTAGAQAFVPKQRVHEDLVGVLLDVVAASRLRVPA